VDIGDVEFVPSREKLAMTDKTVVGVRKYLSDAIKSIQDELELQVQKAPTVWQARKMLHDIKHSILGKVRSMTTVMYDGKEIYEYISLNKLYVKDDEIPDYIKPRFESFSLKKENYKRSDENTIYCDGTVIYFNDLEHGGYARINQHLRSNGDKKGFCVSNATQEFLDETGIGEVAIRASSLPKPERAKRERVEGEASGYVKRTLLQEYAPGGGSYAGNWWQDVEVDLLEGGVYVVVSYGQIVEGENAKRSPQDIRHRFNVIKTLNPDFKLLAIRPAHLEKMGKHAHKWIKFDDYANVLLKEKEGFAEITLAHLQYKEVENKDHYEFFYETTFEDYSLFGGFVEKLKAARIYKDNEIATAYAALDNCCTVKCPLLSKKMALEHMRVQIEKMYPLFARLDWWSIRSGSAEDVAEYIRAMDDRRMDNIVAHRPAVREAEVHLEEAV
jgi:hypothetical protein